MPASARKLVAHYVDEHGAPKALALCAPRDKPVSKLTKMLSKKGGCLADASLVDWTGAAIDGSTLVGDVATDAVAVRGGPAVNRPYLRLDARDHDATHLWRLVELGVHALRAPVVVSHATARNGFDLTAWTETLRARLLRRPARDVQHVTRTRSNGASKKGKPVVATYREILEDRVPASTAGRSGVTMCELALQREPDLLVRVLKALPLDECRPAWAPGGGNLFESDAFPPLLKPPPMCLVIGGDHASCDLHADHYGWVGWSLLCRGAKKWRFSERTAARDAEYRGTRQAVFDDVQGLEGRGVAGSFQSDVDLYAGPRAASDYDVDTAVGDLLVFPGDLWHQTLHSGGDTLSVCSQFCSRPGLAAVLGHVRDWHEQGPEPADRRLLPDAERVMRTLVDCLGAQRARSVAGLATEPIPWRQAYAAAGDTPAADGPALAAADSSDDDLDGFGGLDD